MRSASAQRAVLGFTLSELQLALAREWHLPALLLDLMDDRQAGKPRVQIVKLSVSVARHAANGWYDAALPDDYAGLRKLTSLPPDQVKRWVRQSALQAARHWRDFGVRPAGPWPPDWRKPGTERSAGPSSHAVSISSARCQSRQRSWRSRSTRAGKVWGCDGFGTAA
jgi:hypothetical protein